MTLCVAISFGELTVEAASDDEPFTVELLRALSATAVDAFEMAMPKTLELSEPVE